MPEGLQKIVVTDDEHRLPYSKGLMAMSIMATGLPPDQAYNIASLIHEQLRDEGTPMVTMDYVRRTAERIMEREVGPKYVENYRKWQSLNKLDKPIIILMGGATGVGKSTVATILASRLGITRQVSTDIIREVMRSLLSPELIPSLFNSSFEASEALRIPVPPNTDKVIVGFLEQAAMVWVGVRALIERAIVERTNFIVEGAHVVPGIIEPQFFKDAIVVHMVLTVEKASEHRSHFEMREVETESARPFDRYLDSFENIRKIQDYVLELADKLQVPVFPNSSMDATVGAILEFVINQVFVEYTAGKAKEGMVEKAMEISTSREAVSETSRRST
ncbi:MAG: zeta toxin family protein [Actinobacteria bacterium]|nr:zeta toxin family protein [Actinomycetota bacterium]MCG2817385.1 hypothetical protein [Actinomycetes bacterium]MBU4217658.1 zeta toxin family protein [Actinomycetota bacterium]MBU4358735.1 zeta toxin family protein [Actinomycetota bacterium]MBU4391725.1 zeta toxin family protein [Actinomycetota bacterium]